MAIDGAPQSQLQDGSRRSYNGFREILRTAYHNPARTWKSTSRCWLRPPVIVKSSRS